MPLSIRPLVKLNMLHKSPRIVLLVVLVLVLDKKPRTTTRTRTRKQNLQQTSSRNVKNSAGIEPYGENPSLAGRSATVEVLREAADRKTKFCTLAPRPFIVRGALGLQPAQLASSDGPGEPLERGPPSSENLSCPARFQWHCKRRRHRAEP
jgi:hypothetical protein